MFLSIIIPVFNEENSIEALLLRLDKLEFPSFVDQTEILIVNDFSDDRSKEIIDTIAAGKNGYRIFHHKTNRGKGAAIRTGIEHARGDMILIQDADLELSPEDIPRMLRTMDKLKVEFVNGSRFLPGIDRPLHSYKRYLANRFFTFLTSLLINVKLTDMACGYKLVSKNLLDKISLTEDRFGFEAELIIKALRVKRNNIAEIPVQYYPRNEGEGKKFRTVDAFRILWVIIKYGLLRVKK
jgi:glycosyltransferase involved in cell wall biosynthesis